ncbi:MAG: carbohydrate kinase family protein [Pseudomonadota bacterium]|nr:carbohydrate kinase family protein [Pseudomonadota bacterium]
MIALICGSMAFDTIMVFEDRFKNHILPDQVHILNVSFLVPSMRREFGGCAGNIAYNLNLLGGEGRPMATVGRDFAPYAEWMDKAGVSRESLKELADDYTAQAYITTDQDDNQITAFHPGAMNQSHINKVSDETGVSIGIVSPDGRQGMIDHATQFMESNIPFIFDPGQGMPMFDGDDLNRFLQQASWLTLNDYEFQLFSERTGKNAGEIAQEVEGLVVTRGGEGSIIYANNKEINIPVAKIDKLADPTGCGDAYRSGLLYGLMNDLDWETTGRLAAVMGAAKIEVNGTQNHAPTRDEIAGRFKDNFNYQPW